MPNDSIPLSKQRLDVLNLLGAKRINYSDYGLNLIYEKNTRRKATKWYAASLKNILSDSHIDNISCWAEEIIEGANKIRENCRDLQISQHLPDWDYKLATPVPDWTICLVADCYFNSYISEFHVDLDNSLYYLDISQLNSRFNKRVPCLLSKEYKIDKTSRSFTEQKLIETMRQLKSSAEHFLGYSPEDIYALLEYNLRASAVFERNDFIQGQKESWFDHTARAIGDLTEPHI